MKTVSYNPNSDYALVKEMVSQLSEQDKIQLKNELISEFRMKELESFVYRKQDDEDLPTMEEIQAEIDAVTRAIEKATDKLESQIPMYGDKFPGNWSVNYKYPLGDNNNWVCGMFTGEFFFFF